ncbi:hypothetical protein GCM10009546_23560 [Actinomadura livida]|uniref:Secreted protein n=1 Tax=Actinomadura livida TaxID=79909 RepID=A0ABP3P974_9ACTN|nr:hypothetical protein GCM10010208_06880 [Actinomadura livida]
MASAVVTTSTGTAAAVIAVAATNSLLSFTEFPVPSVTFHKVDGASAEVVYPAVGRMVYAVVSP